MTANKSLLILPGDGIGPEVMVQVRRVVEWFDHRREVTFEVKEGLVGGAAYDAHRTPITDETMADAMLADAPPAFIALAEADILHDEGAAYAEALAAAGAVVTRRTWHGELHGFLSHCRHSPAAFDAIAEASDWLRRLG